MPKTTIEKTSVSSAARLTKERQAAVSGTKTAGTGAKRSNALCKNCDGECECHVHISSAYLLQPGGPFSRRQQRPPQGCSLLADPRPLSPRTPTRLQQAPLSLHQIVQITVRSRLEARSHHNHHRYCYWCYHRRPRPMVAAAAASEEEEKKSQWRRRGKGAAAA